ncbi:hypothetical protein MNBD_IGNAVI01-2668 [hydrothermal vent metagenome]|uniref:Uncharacterized protein n=1 Tax=hydrothermal vent metagenome TaxID=652676 RepID=A0A3B1BY74_9ZZZZ
MKKIEPYPVASALFFIFEIFYIICMLGKLILVELGVEGFWHMHKLWAKILPGFNELTLYSFVLGLIEVGLGAYLAAYIIIPIYNRLLRKKITDKEISPKPFHVRFKTLFFTILSYTFLLFTICFVYDLFVPQFLNMSIIWKILLPGFSDLSLSSYLIGTFDIIIYSFYSASVIAGVLNYFEKEQFINVT